MMYNKKQAKALGIKNTLDLKSIMLESEGYYKVDKNLKNETFIYFLYLSSVVGIFHTIIYYFNLLIGN